ncbi:MAG TPA: DUF6502 family protein [Steroidobacteraceae bacterium]|jgi:hypothetical protein|nr:DUF6502 family protein [Steroidobacteraceae bacterium]
MKKPSKEKEAVLNVFAALIRPLMRVAFEYGISASEIAGTVRRTYVQALEAKLVEQNRPPTDARLAAVAGLPKSDVTALRDALRSGSPHGLRAGVSLDQLTTLLTAWHTHPNFSGAYGLALDLDVLAVPGSPRHNFKELVEVACPDADAEALLDELISARCVEVVDASTARCLSRTYVPSGEDVTRIARMGRFLGAVSTSLSHNLLRSDAEPAYFERTVVSDDPLSSAGRDKFLSVASERGQELLTELDTFLTQSAMPDKSESGKRYGVGIYFFEDESTGRVDHEPRRLSDRVVPVSGRPTEEIDVLAARPGKE